ncbi:MAG: HAD-IA family hydrolase [Candidatus Rokubacteria bacterium]|nr:HAD-IA family hydrolase [Candidatus Rokubacteria bacterium]
MTRGQLRAIFLDAGNTLLRMNYEAIAHRLGTHGVRVTPAQVQGAEWRARVPLDADLGTTGASTESRGAGDLYMRYILEALGVGDEATARAMAEWTRSFNPPVGLWNLADPDAEEALGLVRGAGLAAGVISNSNGSARSILEALGLLPHLAFVLDSTEIGVEKPDPRVFRLALERARIGPDQAVYIGDLYSVDVRGARAAGIEAVLLDPGGCWGARDCLRAPGVLAAVQLLLDTGRGEDRPL